jgi:hypothetical protein
VLQQRRASSYGKEHDDNSYEPSTQTDEVRHYQTYTKMAKEGQVVVYREM